MLRQNPNETDVSRICLDCFDVTRIAAIKQILRTDTSESSHVLLQCSEVCRKIAQALTLQRAVTPDVIQKCAETCAICADYCEARDMDACAIICWEAAAALGDEMARIAPPMIPAPMMLAAE